MIKLFAITFSTLFLLQSTYIRIDNILEIRDFLSHANLHNERYGDNFLVYLSKHYGKLKESHRKQHQQEQQEHQKPIHHHYPTNVQLDFTFNYIDCTIRTSLFIDPGKSNFYYRDNSSSFEKQKIFQPPRTV